MQAIRIERLSEGGGIATIPLIEDAKTGCPTGASNEFYAFQRRFVMACFESGTVVSLASREAITLPDIRGATLRVTRGTVWLTQENDRKDIVLRPGDNWLVERDGNTVVEAQNAVVFCIVGRQADALKLPARTRRATALWSALATLLTPPPRHHAPYA
jgi:hypothetical protein